MGLPLEDTAQRKQAAPGEEASITRFAAIFAGGTMISRFAGLVRDIVFAHTIPAVPLGSFLFAFSLPNMLRDMLGEGAVNAALVPVLSKAHASSSEEEYRKAVSSLMTLMLGFFLILTAAGILVMPLAPAILSSLRTFTGKELPQSAEELQETVRLMQWTFPYLLFIGAAVFAMAPLFIARRYSTPSWSPALLNFTFIGCAFLFRNHFSNPAWALVIGVWIGGLIQFIVLWADMFLHIGPVFPTFNLHYSAVSSALWLLFPVILGQAAGEVNKLVDRFFALSLGEDTVLALYISNRLVQFPLSIFGISVAVAILPALSKAYALNRDKEQCTLMTSGIRQAFFLTAPATACLIVLRKPVIRLLFQRGEFGETGTEMAASALLYAAMGLVFFSLVKVMVQGFYARHNTKIPVIIASFSMLLNIVLNALLVGPMGYQGLAFATTISYAVNFSLLFFCYNFLVQKLLSPALMLSLIKISAASVLMSFCVWYAHNSLESWLGITSMIQRLVTFTGACAAASLVYTFSCFFLRIDEFAALGRRLLRRK